VALTAEADRAVARGFDQAKAIEFSIAVSPRGQGERQELADTVEKGDVIAGLLLA